MTRCSCGNEAHAFPLHLQAQREAMRIRAVEMGLRQPDEPLPSWCGECILERLAAFLADDEDGLSEADSNPMGVDMDKWIDGIRERMAREERRTR
jgi:hypothetical protein